MLLSTYDDDVYLVRINASQSFEALVQEKVTSVQLCNNQVTETFIVRSLSVPAVVLTQIQSVTTIMAVSLPFTYKTIMEL